jgi:hypothetical protein
VDELRRGGVVHLDPSVEATRVLGVEQALELVVAGAAVEATCDEDRLALRPDAQALELVDGGGEGVAARVVECARQRQLGRLDDQCHTPFPCRQGLERRAGEREAERVADRGSDVGDRVAGQPWTEHSRAVRRVDHGHA